MSVIDFVKEHWKGSLFVVLPVVAFCLGRYTTPQVEKIVERVRIEQVEKQVVVEHETVRVEVVKVKDTQVVERWHREKTETKAPDGTVVTKEVEDKNIDTVVHDKENNTEVKVVTVEKQVVVIQEKFTEKIIDNKRNFRVNALVGISPQITPVPMISSWAVGGEVDVRVLGPVWTGVWAMGTTTGQGLGGLKLGVEF